MGLAIGLGLDARASRAQGGAGAAPPNLVLDDIPRDRMIYDSRASTGGDTAPVALSGTALEPGAVIDLRAWDGAGAVALAEGAATADADGRWSAVLEVPRTALWLHPEARADGGPWVRGPARRRLAAGHVIALWQQSEHDNAQKSFYNGGGTPAIADPEAVQMIGRHLPGGVSGILHCADGAAGMQSGLAAWAAQWIALAPGEKAMLVFNTKDGSSFGTALNDGTAAEEGAGHREWSDDVAMTALATADGATHVGLAWADWYAAPGSEGLSYGANRLRQFFRVDADGNAVAKATDHDFADLYDYALTRWHLADPHRFESENQSREDCRTAIRAVWRTAGAAGRILPPGLANVAYLNGYDDGAGGWTDYTHPGRLDADGMQRMMRFTALQMAAALGRYGLTPPAFDRCEWEAAGAWVEVWSSAGAVTTERLARGEAAIDAAAHPWATQVAGFLVDGAPADRAEIVAGRVRIHPLAGGTFDGSEVLTFGENGAAGNPAAVEDALRQGWWKNLPVVDMGVPVLGRVPVLPMPDAAVLANTVETGGGAAPALFERRADGGGIDTRFRQDDVGGSIGEGRGALSGQLSVVLDYALVNDSDHEVWEISDTRAEIKVVARSGIAQTGRMQVFFKDENMVNVAVFNFADAALTASGARLDVEWGVRYPSATEPAAAWVRVNGALHDAPDVLAPAGGTLPALPATRRLRYLGNSAPGRFSACRMWWGYAGPGILPSGAPDMLIGPDLAGINAHPWRTGGAATAV